jgi:hypothetical protein
MMVKLLHRSSPVIAAIIGGLIATVITGAIIVLFHPFHNVSDDVKAFTDAVFTAVLAYGGGALERKRIQRSANKAAKEAVRSYEEGELKMPESPTE